jgi:anti-sigma factor ChrR (cupin superfamily)
MDTHVASEIARIEHQLRAALEDISARVAVGAAREHTLALVRQARALADTLERTVDRLDDDDGAEGLRRMAAYLSAHLVVLERDSTGAAIH